MSDYSGSENIKEKLLRALKHKAVLAERSKQLQQQVEDFRTREASMNHVASELLQRQRELNFMLHRASSVLHQMQDTNLALSAEFTHIVKELPAPRDGENQSSDWEDTISRVNDLFRRTHELAGEMQDEIFRSAAGSPLPDPGKDITAASFETPIAPEPAPRPVVEPPSAQMHEPEPTAHIIEHAPIEAVGDAAPTIDVETDQPPVFRPVAETETEEEIYTNAALAPEIVEATIIEQRAEVEEAQSDESVEDIFRRLNAVQVDTEEWREDGSSAESPRKPSLLARIFGYGDDE